MDFKICTIIRLSERWEKNIGRKATEKLIKKTKRDTEEDDTSQKKAYSYEEEKILWKRKQKIKEEK
jgi:hypothetical protein